MTVHGKFHAFGNRPKVAHGIDDVDWQLTPINFSIRSLQSKARHQSSRVKCNKCIKQPFESTNHQSICWKRPFVLVLKMQLYEPAMVFGKRRTQIRSHTNIEANRSGAGERESRLFVIMLFCFVLFHLKLYLSKCINSIWEFVIVGCFEWLKRL